MALEQQNAPKTKALELAIQSIEKQFGKGSIMRLGTGQGLHEGIQAIPTGSLSLDLALGIGGIPKGRIIEIYGPESSGKTTLALTAVAECQKQGGTAAFVDAEHALDVEYARKLGVDVENLLLSQPDTGEQALEITDMLIKSSAVDILVVDSVAALVPRAELEGEMGDATMGAQARLMSQALRKLTGSIHKSKSTVIFINQVRMKIGVMFGNPETTTGGNALKFYASVRMDVRRVAAIKNGDDVVGNRTRVKVVKNKVSPPFKEVEFDILYGKGICKEGDLLDLATGMNLIEKSGTWYSYNGERLGQGRESARDFLKSNPKILVEIREKVLKAKGIHNHGASTPAAAEEASKSAISASPAKLDAKAAMVPPVKNEKAANPALKAKH
jgi:recombination protein RecA